MVVKGSDHVATVGRSPTHPLFIRTAGENDCFGDQGIAAQSVRNEPRVGDELTHVLGSLRSRVLTPSFREATLEKRGFQVKDDASRELLERIGTTFLTGFSYAVGADSPRAAGAALDDVPTRFRGFAYEGAAMGFAVLDGLAPLRRDRFTRFADGIGRDHPYMVQVGLGWALARLPRFRWPKPSGEPLLHWLVLDGYGFHEAYFHTGRVVARRAEQPPVRRREPGHACTGRGRWTRASAEHCGSSAAPTRGGWPS